MSNPDQQPVRNHQYTCRRAGARADHAGHAALGHSVVPRRWWTFQNQTYHLHGVLVHSGDSHGGHYCAFIRPQPSGHWLKFDDDRVTRCSQKEAMDDNFGVEPVDPSMHSPASPRSVPPPPRATLTQPSFRGSLVYVRERRQRPSMRRVRVSCESSPTPTCWCTSARRS